MLNKLATLTDDEKKRGVISISANHAQALAYASAVRIDACRHADGSLMDRRGAVTAQHDTEADTGGVRAVRGAIESTGRTLVHPYDDPP